MKRGSSSLTVPWLLHTSPLYSTYRGVNSQPWENLGGEGVLSSPNFGPKFGSLSILYFRIQKKHSQVTGMCHSPQVLHVLTVPYLLLQICSMPDLLLLQNCSMPDLLFQICSMADLLLQICSMPDLLLQICSMPDLLLQIAVCQTSIWLEFKTPFVVFTFRQLGLMAGYNGEAYVTLAPQPNLTAKSAPK